MEYRRSGETVKGFLQNAVHVHDLNATIPHSLGPDHEKLTYRASGRNLRLTDVYGKVVQGIIASGRSGFTPIF